MTSSSGRELERDEDAIDELGLAIADFGAVELVAFEATEAADLLVCACATAEERS
jgi:hypothetical protein